MDLLEGLEREIGPQVRQYPNEYLGDGVYMFFDGWCVIVACSRGYNVHWMVLEPTMIEGLGRFIERAKAKLSEQKEGQ